MICEDDFEEKEFLIHVYLLRLIWVARVFPLSDIWF